MGTGNRTDDGFEPVQEMRLAVVMYGGISLAIYMNGIAQEMLALVRATAPKDDGNRLFLSESELSGAGRAYRKLGRLLGAGPPKDDRDPAHGPVRTRFVIDILTGTSAGGLNGVFLAKALSNQSTMDQLCRMWRLDGHIPTLLADSVASGGDQMPSCSPDALLNGERIYRLLHEALRGMNGDTSDHVDQAHTCNSPYVEELDLFVTSTDVTGLMMPIKLQDQVIFERRYRNFTHFRYGYPDSSGTPYNSFHAGNDPFLAFACRCTSAFPFAFPPMSLGRATSYADLPLRDEWSAFYADYVCAANSPGPVCVRPAGTDDGRGNVVQKNRADNVPFPDRYFIDGGCLDNKPFSYAVDALRWKQASIPVVRKLLYVEPDPLNPACQQIATGAPDAMGTVVAGYLDLPQAERIRDDLQRVLERNRLISRVRDVTSNVQPWFDRTDTKSSTEAWRQKRVRDLARPESPSEQAYSAYHRMKISAVTDYITTVIVCAAGLDVDSDDALAVRYLVKAWRDTNYPDVSDPGATFGRTSSEFLMDFDFDYRIRRLSLLRRYIDVYYQHYAKVALRYPGIRRCEEQPESILVRLQELKRRVNRIRRALLRTHEWLATTEKTISNPLRDAVMAFNEGGRFTAAAGRVLARHSDSARLKSAREIYSDPAYAELFDHVAKTLSVMLKAGDREDPSRQKGWLERQEVPPRIGFYEAARLSEELLEEFPIRPISRVRNTSGRIERIWPLPSYYRGYEAYDAATFPMMFGADVGEPTPIEVVRVSPVDTTRLPRPASGASKLAGVGLGHFAAFLDQCWRENDILWGRLDAVERIIKGLGSELPPETQNALIEEAHLGVLEEWCATVNRQGEGAALYAAIKAGRLYGDPTNPATRSDWLLTPELFAAAARDGAKAGLPAITHDAAQDLGQRAIDTVSGVLAGVSRNDGNTPPVKVASTVLGLVLGLCGTLLKAPLIASGLAATGGFFLALVVYLMTPRTVGIPLGVVLVLLAFVAPFWVYRKVETAIDRLLSVSPSEV